VRAKQMVDGKNMGVGGLDLTLYRGVVLRVRRKMCKIVCI
jgi:hypothetical protein